MNYATGRNLRSRKKIIQLPPWRIVPRERPVSLPYAGPLGGENCRYIFLHSSSTNSSDALLLHSSPRIFFSSATVESSLPNGNLARRCLCLSPSLFPSFSFLLVRIFRLGRCEFFRSRNLILYNFLRSR